MGIKLWISPELDLKPVFPTDSYLIQLALNTPELVLNTPDKPPPNKSRFMGICRSKNMN
jgi:hypothetical protein